MIDHSVMVDHFGSDSALTRNTELEVARNRERYQFLKWGQQAFNNLKVVPPGTGIVHQVNLEYLARGVFSAEKDGKLTKAFAEYQALISTYRSSSQFSAALDRQFDVAQKCGED